MTALEQYRAARQAAYEAWLQTEHGSAARDAGNRARQRGIRSAAGGRVNAPRKGAE